MKRHPFATTIDAHRVADRYGIPASESEVFAADERDARELAVRNAHIRAGVPAWLPYLRESWEHSRAVEAAAPLKLGV